MHWSAVQLRLSLLSGSYCVPTSLHLLGIIMRQTKLMKSIVVHISDMAVMTIDCTDFGSGTRSSHFVMSVPWQHPSCIRNIRAIIVCVVSLCCGGERTRTLALQDVHHGIPGGIPSSTCSACLRRDTSQMHRSISPAFLFFSMVRSCCCVSSCSQSIRFSKCITEPTPVCVATARAADESGDP